MIFGPPSRCLAVIALSSLMIVGCGTSSSTPTPTDDSLTNTDGNSTANSSETKANESVDPQSANVTLSNNQEPASEDSQMTAADRETQGDAVPQDRRLPGPKSLTQDGTENEAVDATSEPGWNPDEPTNEEIAAVAFLPPPGATKLTAKGNLWVNTEKKRVYLDGYVALKSGVLEMFACPVGTKEHESVVATLAKAREVHAALLAVDATPGAPVRFRPEFSPPTGQVIRVWVCWYDPAGQFQVVDARQWVQDAETEKQMDAEWVFAGSGFWEDPDDKREYYMADSGDMICVSNFASAMIDVSIPSSADTGSLRFVPFESRIPEPSTPVRLILVPVPNPTADGATEEKLAAPTEQEIPRAK